MKQRLAKRIVLSCWLSIVLSTTLAQSLRVDAHCERCEIEDILQALSARYGFVFAYEVQQVRGLTATVKAERQPIEALLGEILAPHQLQAEHLGQGRFTIIKQRNATLARAAVNSRVLVGTVKQADTGDPLVFASVRLSQQRGASTDEQGQFRLVLTPPFPDSMRITYLGYLPTTVACRYDAPVEVVLTPNFTSIDDIVITDGAKQTLKVGDGGGTIQLDPGRLHLLSGLGEGDLLRGLQLLPGSTSANERATGMFVRGGTPSENLILFDGITVYQPGHFFGVLSAFNPEAIKDVRMYRSGMGARYGGRTAALVDITGRPGRISKSRGGVSLNFLNAQVFAEVPWENEKGGLLVAARRSYTDVAPSAFFQSMFDNRFQEGFIYFNNQQSQINDQLRVEPRLHYFDINAKWLYRPNDRDLISVTAIKSGDELRYSTDAQSQNGPNIRTEDQLRLVNEGASLTAARHWNSRHYTRFNSAYSSTRNIFHNTFLIDGPAFQYRSDLRRSQFLQDLSTRLEHTWVPGKAWRFTGGLHQSHLWLRDALGLDDNLSEAVIDLQPATQLLHALFAEGAWTGTHAGVEAGWRQHLLAGSPQFYAEPRIMGYVLPARNWRIQANAGRYHQFLNHASVYNGLEAGEEFWVLALEDSIPVLRSDMASLSLSWNREALLLQVEAYYKRTSGLLAYEVRYNPTLNETDFGDLLTDGEGHVGGLELMVQKKTGAYTGWIAYTYSRVWQRFAQAEEQRYLPAAFDRPHQLSVVNQYTSGFWEFSAVWVLASGIPYTPAESVSEFQLPTGGRLFFLNFGGRNSQRLPAYHRLDLTATYRIELPGSSARLGVSVFNAYGQRNIGNRVFAVDRPSNAQDTASVIALDKPLLGFTPNVFLSWEW